MSRKKKSRKPGVAPTSANKDDNKKKAEPNEIRFKKPHGKAPGNRQQEALKPHKNSATPAIKKDPRIGSKTPIVLVKSSEKETPPTIKKNVSTPMAKIRKIDTQQADFDELQAIEADPKVQEIVQKQEQEIALTESEIEYFNEKMDRHNTLSEKLGLDDDEDDRPQQPNKALDEDDLWDKLDNSDFSDFE